MSVYVLSWSFVETTAESMVAACWVDEIRKSLQRNYTLVVNPNTELFKIQKLQLSHMQFRLSATSLLYYFVSIRQL